MKNLNLRMLLLVLPLNLLLVANSASAGLALASGQRVILSCKIQNGAAESIQIIADQSTYERLGAVRFSPNQNVVIRRATRGIYVDLPAYISAQKVAGPVKHGLMAEYTISSEGMPRLEVQVFGLDDFAPPSCRWIK